MPARSLAKLCLPLLCLLAGGGTLAQNDTDDDGQAHGSLPLWREILLESEAALEVGNATDAIDLAKDARNYCAEDIEDRSRACTIVEGAVGWAVHKRGRREEAYGILSAAHEQANAAFASDDPELFTIAANLGVVATTLGKREEAEELLRFALDGRGAILGLNHPDTLAVMNRLSGQLTLSGKLGEAERLSLTVVEQLRRQLGIGHRDTLAAINGLGFVYLYQGRNQDAAALFGEVIAANAETAIMLNGDLMVIYSNLGRAQAALGQLEQAEQTYRDAISRSMNYWGPDNFNTLIGKNNLAATLLRQGKYDEAEALLRELLATGERIYGTDATLYSTKSLLGSVLLETGRTAEAETLIVEVLQGRLRRATPTNLELVYAWQSMARLSEATQPEPDKAIFFYKQAVNQLQGVRASLSDRSAQSQDAFSEQWFDLYERLQELLVEQGRFLEAEQVGQMQKRAEYLGFVRGNSEASAGADADLTATEQQWAAELASWMERPNRVAAEIRELRSQEPDSGGMREVRLEQLETLYDQQYSEFREQISVWLSEVSEIEDRQIADEAQAVGIASVERLQAIVASAGDDVALLQIVSFEDTIHYFLTTPDAFKHAEQRIARSELFAAISNARELIREGGYEPGALEGGETELQAQMGELFDYLIRPIAGELEDAGTTTLMLNLQGRLRYVPFAALYDGENWLVEKYRLALYSPAAQTRFDDGGDMRSGAGFGLSQAVEGFSPLPAVPDELDAILTAGDSVGVLEGQFKLDTGFTRSALEADLTSPHPIIHIASHFTMKPGNESASFLLLGDGNRLTLEDINRSSRLRFRNVDLVTLSACQTALSGDGSGIEIEGLGALLQNKGASAVMATLWSVADESTAQLMIDFYSGMSDGGLSKAEALRQAQISMIQSEEFGDPFYWAPFVIMGNWK